MLKDESATGVLVESSLGLADLRGHSPEKRHSKPGRTIVSMGQGKVVEASPHDTEVFTFGAGGCNVVAIEGTRRGKRFGAITHYDPLSLEVNLQQLDTLGGNIGKAGRGEESNAEIFVLGVLEKIEGKWKKKPQDPGEAAKLSYAVKKAFGDSTVVTVTPYSQKMESGRIDQGTVSVDISPQPQRTSRILGIF